MISRLYRLATCIAGLILLSTAYQAAPSIVAHSAPEDMGLAAILGIGIGLLGMGGGAALVLFSIFVPDETL